MDQLLEAMCNAFSEAADNSVSVDQTLRKRMDAARRVCVGEIADYLDSIGTNLGTRIRSRYLKPKSAEEIMRESIKKLLITNFSTVEAQVNEIVAAVRKADQDSTPR